MNTIVDNTASGWSDINDERKDLHGIPQTEGRYGKLGHCNIKDGDWVCNINGELIMNIQ